MNHLSTWPLFFVTFAPRRPPTPTLPHKGGGSEKRALPPCGGGLGWGVASGERCRSTVARCLEERRASHALRGAPSMTVTARPVRRFLLSDLLVLIATTALALTWGRLYLLNAQEFG